MKTKFVTANGQQAICGIPSNVYPNAIVAIDPYNYKIDSDKNNISEEYIENGETLVNAFKYEKQ